MKTIPYKNRIINVGLLFAVIIITAVSLCQIKVSAAAKIIYVAGNPDLYPIEYYDNDNKRYAGLMPEMFAILSENTGYSFEYINASALNEQERMAKNCQTEIISAYKQGDIDMQYLRSPLYITTFLDDGREQHVYIAFSEIASDELISDITQALSEISADKRLELLVSHTAHSSFNRMHLILITVLSIMLILFAGALLRFIIYYYNRHKENRENIMIDSRYGIGNSEYYIYSFENLISDNSKSLYYVAYIAFDDQLFTNRYGSADCDNIRRYTAELLSSRTSATDYLSLVKDGVFVLTYQSSNIDAAKEHIERILDELDEYLSSFKNEYAGLFHAGVCSLGENMDCQSESALYNAKQGYLCAVDKKIRFAFSTRNMIEQIQQNERIHHSITQAIKNGEFQMYLQYIVDRNGKVFGAEAVSRWQNPQEGLLTPARYIEIMNQTGTVTTHDYYIFSKVCEQLEKWKNSNNDGLYISCNFTRYSFTEIDFADKIKEISDKYAFDRSRLIIEITEDSLSHNTAIMQANAEKCRKLGFLIAIDDIGSGYTSLMDFYDYPIDFVKVERNIVLNAANEKGRMLLKGLVGLAHSMNVKVLCEGVETTEQRDTVLRAGCDFIQGFYYSRVLPVREADRFLRKALRGSFAAAKK